MFMNHLGTLCPSNLSFLFGTDMYPLRYICPETKYTIFASSEFWPSGQPKHGGNREGSFAIDRVMPRMGSRNNYVKVEGATNVIYQRRLGERPVPCPLKSAKYCCQNFKGLVVHKFHHNT